MQHNNIFIKQDAGTATLFLQYSGSDSRSSVGLGILRNGNQQYEHKLASLNIGLNRILKLDQKSNWESAD